MSHIVGSLSEWRILMQINDLIGERSVPQIKAFGYLKSLEMLKDTATSLGMATTKHIIDDEYEDIFAIITSKRPLGVYHLQKLTAFSEKIFSVFTAELKSRPFIALAPGQSEFLSPTEPLFGAVVDDAFPSAAQEIADAGRCRAMGMWTAAVMHLMRALEDALAALAKYIEIEVSANWNATLNQIDLKLKERNKKTFGENEEQWAAEASAHLRNVKNAWRNHAAHGRARYNEEEAVAIWNNVQSLMQTLAKKLQK